MPERRTAHRIEVDLPVRYSSDAVTLAGVVSSLSRSGLFVRTDFLDSRGQTVSVAVSLPGDREPLHLSGEVVRVVEHPSRAGMAIRFVRPPAPERRRLADFMIARSYQSRT